LRVALYRVLLKLGVHPVQKIKSLTINGIFFNDPLNALLKPNSDIYLFHKLEKGYYPFSGDYVTFGDATPNWHKNYFNNSESKSKNLDWWKISDFDSNLGDIKTVWELSRFDWAVQLAITGFSGDKRAIYLLNSRLNDWIKENPYYQGANWKCGQEASIRVLHLILAALILDQSKNSSKALISLVEAHIKRIAPTILYAIAQNNNHGTSEAAALFIGGHFLVSNGLVEYENYELLGRNWLEDRATKLFFNDGCFSQYSVNYHRLALDTYSLCETYRKMFNLTPFSNPLQNKMKKAINWLEILTDSETGDVPNIGSNDGAQLFSMFNFEYRDYRKSVQWANLVFNERLIYSTTENQDKVFSQLGINVMSALKDNPLQDALLMGNESGFFIYRKKDLLLVFRRPIFKFRPSHSDALHVDFWLGGVNVLRDGGSYSYNKSKEKTIYYNGGLSHNSIQFDKRDQMPVLGRFLFGSWLKEIEFKYENPNDDFIISSAYIDYLNAYHKRKIVINKNSLSVIDHYSGGDEITQLKWRLSPNKFVFINSNNMNDEISIDLKKGVISGEYNLNHEFESRYYYKESTLPVISKDLKKSGTILTNIIW
jgi:hypothetical protein